MGYMSAHNKTRRVRGSARNYLCVQCGGGAQEWALPRDCVRIKRDWHGTYSDDPADYLPMCFHCHRVYDKAAITHCPHGHPYEGANLLMDAGKRKCRTCVYARNRKRKLTPKQRKRQTELQRERRRLARERAA